MKKLSMLALAALATFTRAEEAQEVEEADSDSTYEIDQGVLKLTADTFYKP